MLSAAPLAEKISSALSVPIQKKPSPVAPPVTKSNDLFCEKSYETICKGEAVADPTGETSLDYRGEIRALRVLRKIVRTNPGWTTEQIEDDLVKRIYTKERKERLQRIFENVRAQMIFFIKQQHSGVFAESDKQLLVERIGKVKLDLPEDRTTYADATDLYTKSEIYYESNREAGIFRVRVGGAYILETSSEFSIVFSMAHELAHAIDPCEMQGQPFNYQPYQNLVQCFVDSQWIKKEETQCGGTDKSAEVFADWMGAEILARSLRNQTKYTLVEKARAAINAVRDLCDDSSGFEKVNLDYYPTDQVRVNRIFARNTLLRRELQCSNSNTNANTSSLKPYCRFESPKLKGPPR